VEVDLTVGYTGVSTIYKNVVMLGAAVPETPPGLPGDSRAFDANTARKLWEFHSVPQPGERGHESWLDDGWKARSGVNVWGFYLTVDEQRGIVYLPFGGQRTHRKTQMAFPDRPSRYLGFGLATRAWPGRYREGRTTNPRAGAGRQDRLDVHSGSRYREACVQSGKAPGTQMRRTWRVVHTLPLSLSHWRLRRWPASVSVRKTLSPPWILTEPSQFRVIFGEI
jgi:hypothetical protein